MLRSGGQDFRKLIECFNPALAPANAFAPLFRAISVPCFFGFGVSGCSAEIGVTCDQGRRGRSGLRTATGKPQQR